MLAGHQNGRWRHTIAVIGFTVLAGTSVVEGQVGFASRESRVYLVATVPAGASMHAVDVLREEGRQGLIRKASITVSVATSQSFRLNVRQSGPSNDRIWVQDALGEFREISPGPGVTVFQGGPTDATSVKELRYRVEQTNATDPLRELPLRYEIVVDPTL